MSAVNANQRHDTRSGVRIDRRSLRRLKFEMRLPRYVLYAVVLAAILYSLAAIVAPRLASARVVAPQSWRESQRGPDRASLRSSDARLTHMVSCAMTATCSPPLGRRSPNPLGGT